MKISVITVSYNSAATIADTLRSVENQTYRQFEHLVIDGQSSDDTLLIIESNSHSNLAVCSEPDSGIYDAMNKGLRLAKGDVVGFLNSDDYFSDNNALQKIAHAFDDSAVQACYGDLVYINQQDGRVVRYWKSKPYEKGDFSKGWCPAHPTFYIRREALERLGLFDLSFKLAADAEFMMRYLEFGGVKAFYIPSVLVKMRLGGATNRNWQNIRKQNIEILMALRKNHISVNIPLFWMHKLFNRLLQFLSVRKFVG